MRLRSLALRRNFRSAPAIVSWVNTAFARVFPSDDRVETGQAAFRDSVVTRPAEGGQFVRTHAAPAERGAEVASVIAILDEERRRDAAQSIAVLVQNRRHLEGLRERLREHGFAVHAVEIDSLGEQSIAQDLVALTRALLHFDDRIAWLAVLLLAVGSVVGGQIGAKIGRRLPPAVLRAVIVLVGVVAITQILTR